MSFSIGYHLSGVHSVEPRPQRGSTTMDFLPYLRNSINVVTSWEEYIILMVNSYAAPTRSMVYSVTRSTLSIANSDYFINGRIVQVLTNALVNRLTLGLRGIVTFRPLRLFNCLPGDLVGVTLRLFADIFSS